MDEIFGLTEAEFILSLPVPNDSNVYRQVHKNDLDKQSRRFPQAKHFKLKKDELDLSVNWATYVTIDEVFYLIGLSHNAKGNFKDVRMYEVFKFPVDFLRKLEGIEKVVHSPVLNGNPAPVGRPNIYAHTSVFYPDDEEVRKKLSNYCNDDYKNSYCSINIELIEPIIEKLRERLNNTKYHRCKI